MRRLIVALTFLAYAVAPASGHPTQFDLVCKLVSKAHHEPHPDRFGTGYYLGNPNFRAHARYVVDLKRKIYDRYPLRYQNTMPILAATQRRIVFMRGPDLNQYYDFDSHQFRREEVLDAEQSSITTGHCRIAKFSGFPQPPTTMRKG